MANAKRHFVPNLRLRAIREARSESRSEFARALRRQAEAMGENVACDETRVARWERGEVRWPRSAYRRVLTAMLGVPIRQLGFHPPHGVSDAVTASGEVVPASARLARSVPSSSSSLVPTWEEPAEPGVDEPGPNGPGADEPSADEPDSPVGIWPVFGPVLELSPGTLESLEESVEDLCRGYGHRPVSEVVGLAQKRLAFVRRLLEDGMRPTERRRVLTVAGWLTAVLGCALFDSGQRRRAETHRLAVRDFASEAGHGELAAWSWEMATFFAVAESRFADALAFVRAGETASEDSAVAARLALHEAKIAARLRNRREAEDALERAERIVDRLSWPHDEEHHFAMDDVRVTAHSATAYLWLGDDTAAEDCGWQVLARQLNPDNTTRHPMRVAEMRITLGITAARRGDIEQAAYFGTAALEAERVSLPMLISRAAELEAVLLAAYKNAPPTAEFSDRLAELRRRLRGTGARRRPD
jgi:transcriptional regulator with XRE-family HTH domain